MIEDGREDQEIAEDLYHAGTYVCHGNLSVVGAIRVGSLKVAGDVSTTADVLIAYGARVGGSINVAGRLQLGGDMIVAGDVNAADGIRVGGRVECGGQIVSRQDVTAQGNIQVAKGIDAAGNVTSVAGNVASLGGEVRARGAIVAGRRLHARKIAAGSTIAAGVSGDDGTITGEVLSGRIISGTHGGSVGG